MSKPVLTTGAVTAAVAAVLTLLVAFGVDLTQQQTSAVMGLVAVLAPMAVALSTRYVTDHKHDEGEEQ